MATADAKQKPWRDEEKLRELYWEEGMSTVDIANEFDCTNKTISDWMRRLGIDMRNRGEAESKGHLSDFAYKKLNNRNWLERKYYDEELSLREIAAVVNVSAETVSKWMDRHDLETRDQSTAGSKAKLPKGTYQKLSDGEWLKEKYWGEELSTVKIGNILGVSHRTVVRWMRKLGVERRDNVGENHTQWLGDELEFECEVCGSVERKTARESAGRFCSYECMGKWQSENWVGENSPTWQGGYDPHKGKLWEEQRQRVLERDGYVCQRCGMDNEKHKEKHGISLNIHHITPAREFDDYEKQNDLDNLITLCVSCHGKLEGLPIDRQTLSD